jgi:hypothetical protein
MKKIFYYLLTILLFSCSSSKLPNTQTPVGEGYKIPEKDVAKILARLNKCGLFNKCTGLGDGYKYDAEYKYVVDKYGATNVSEVSARFRKRDQKSYAKLWGLNLKSDTAKVKVFKTYILKVESQDEKDKASATYYYVIKLCPPPRGCPDSLFSFSRFDPTKKL